MNLPHKTPDYNQLLRQIGSVCTDGQKATLQSVQRTLLLTYWQIGQTIVEFEQARAEYGSQVLPRLSCDLSDQFGKEFSLSNLISKRLLFRLYPDKALLSNKLTWAHYVELVKYVTYGMDSQLFVSKYQLYLPDAEQLRQTLEAALDTNLN